MTSIGRVSHRLLRRTIPSPRRDPRRGFQCHEQSCAAKRERYHGPYGMEPWYRVRPDGETACGNRAAAPQRSQDSPDEIPLHAALEPDVSAWLVHLDFLSTHEL